jgi:hypothetical protein
VGTGVLVAVGFAVVGTGVLVTVGLTVVGTGVLVAVGLTVVDIAEGVAVGEPAPVFTLIPLTVTVAGLVTPPDGLLNWRPKLIEPPLELIVGL